MPNNTQPAEATGATIVGNSRLIDTLSHEDLRTQEQLIDNERRMAKQAKNFLELGAYEQAAICAMRADALQWMGSLFLRGD